MTALSALLVDDSPSARLFLKNMLEAHDVRVAVAESGASALNWLKAHRPDVVFLDHVMADMDGIETMARLKNDPTTADIPVVMCTSTDEEGFVTEVRRLGALTVLPKPPIPSLLSDLLQQLGTIRSGEEYAASTEAPADVEPVVPTRQDEPVFAMPPRSFVPQQGGLRGPAQPPPRTGVRPAFDHQGPGSLAEAAQRPSGEPGVDFEGVAAFLWTQLDEQIKLLEAKLRLTITQSLDAKGLDALAQTQIDEQVRAMEARLRQSLGQGDQAQLEAMARDHLDEQLRSMERRLQKAVKDQIAERLEDFEGRVGRIVTNELKTNFAAFEAYLQSRASEFDKAPVDQWRSQLFSDPGVKDVLRKAAAGAAETAVERMLVGIRGSDLERTLAQRLEEGLDSKESALRREMADSMRDINQRVAGAAVVVALIAATVGVVAAILF